MRTLKIIDSMFGHNRSAGSVIQTLDQDIIWDRNVSVNDDIVFYTEGFVNPNYGKKKIALLIESPLVTTNLYNEIVQNYNKFDHILTFDKNLLKLSQKFIFYELGGCWVNFIDNSIKTSNISIIASGKNSLPGHRLRHSIINRFKNKIDCICGNGYKRINDKSEALYNFRYSMIVENCQHDFYFSEKLIDCFASKTIPIYWGCTVDRFFDPNGMINFNSIDELDNIISQCDDRYYNSKLDSVNRNFELAKKYAITENNIERAIKDIF